jgi:hypothetical protein
VGKERESRFENQRIHEIGIEAQGRLHLLVGQRKLHFGQICLGIVIMLLLRRQR